MITAASAVSFPETYPLEKLGRREDLLFFDIETTGFSGDASQVYLIGAVFWENGGWQLIQWFADTPASEPELLNAFFSLLKRYSVLVHFNGDTFDIPFLLKRCRQYGLPCSFSEVQSVDLYKRIRPFRKLLGLDSLKQKAIERFLGICRQDPFSSGQLIEVYQEYLVSRDDRLYGMLMLHNREDLEGMPLILPILAYPDFLEHEFVLEDQQLMESSEAPALRLRLRGCCRLPAAFSRESGGIAISASDSLLTLEIPLFAGTLKHFYPNYHDYYYLVCEDTAIHKSVGAFVDRNARKKATAATCYTKKCGLFLPQPVPIWEPVMKEDCRSRLTYVEYRPQLFQSPDCLSRYVREILKAAGR